MRGWNEAACERPSQSRRKPGGWIDSICAPEQCRVSPITQESQDGPKQRVVLPNGANRNDAEAARVRRVIRDVFEASALHGPVESNLPECLSQKRRLSQARFDHHQPVRLKGERKWDAR